MHIYIHIYICVCECIGLPILGDHEVLFTKANMDQLLLLPLLLACSSHASSKAARFRRRVWTEPLHHLKHANLRVVLSSSTRRLDRI